MFRLVSVLCVVLAPPCFAAGGADPFLKSMLGVLSGKGKSGFSTSGCPRVPPASWAALLLAGQPVVIDYRFGPGCDVQGKLRITTSPFPIDLELRHIPEGKRVRATVASETQTDLRNGQILLSAHSNDATLLDTGGKELMAFGGNYRLALGFDGQPRPGSGGELRAHRIRGKTTHAKLTFP